MYRKNQLLVVLGLMGAEQSGREYLYEALDYVAKGKVRVMTETFPKFSFLDLPCALSLNFEGFSAGILWARSTISSFRTVLLKKRKKKGKSKLELRPVMLNGVL